MSALWADFTVSPFYFLVAGFRAYGIACCHARFKVPLSRQQNPVAVEN